MAKSDWGLPRVRLGISLAQGVAVRHRVLSWSIWREHHWCCWLSHYSGVSVGQQLWCIQHEADAFLQQTSTGGGLNYPGWMSALWTGKGQGWLPHPPMPKTPDPQFLKQYMPLSFFSFRKAPLHCCSWKLAWGGLLAHCCIQNVTGLERFGHKQHRSLLTACGFPSHDANPMTIDDPDHGHQNPLPF